MHRKSIDTDTDTDTDADADAAKYCKDEFFRNGFF
jgi:hypothetical protein